MRSLFINVLLFGAPLCACVDISEPTAQVESNIESGNALSLNALSLNALSLNALSLNALSLNGTDIVNTDACSTPEGRSVLKYLAGCALPAGTTLSCSGYPDVFYGNIGLAPQWLNGSLDLASQYWVSGCLLAHVNNFAVPIQISLAGNHPALARSAEEQATYSYHEANFFGNLFDSQPNYSSDGVYFGTLGRVACQHEVARTVVTDWYLRMRVCAMPGDPGWTRCNFVDAGRCRPDPGETTSACLATSGEYDWRCAGGQVYPGWGKEESSDGTDHGTMLNNQVVTVYLRPSDAHDMRSAACQVALSFGWVGDCNNVDDDSAINSGGQHSFESTSASN